MGALRIARAAALGAALAAACTADEGAGDGAGVPMRAAGGGADREEVLGPFLSAHWSVPVPAQGAAPEGWSATEASLRPQDCRSCHPKQWQEWRASRHAGAFSPGFAGQLIEGGLSGAEAMRGCQTCHAPLEEQQPLSATGATNPAYDPPLRRAGLVCAGCHVRAHRRLGPPRRAELPPLPADVALPHGGFEPRPEFQESRFCAPCHQFWGDAGVAGKPVENTFAEWRASPQAAEGRTCQSCHMPERGHGSRGIHDPETVRAAVDVELAPLAEVDGELRTALRVRNRDVGHAFPTYVTPRVEVHVFQVDAGGAELPGTRASGVIGRKVDFGARREVFDTRVRAGESFALAYALPRAPGAARVVGRVVVDPDFHYRGVFEAYLPTLSDPEAKRLIAEALRRTQGSTYLLSELEAEAPPLASARRSP